MSTADFILQIPLQLHASPHNLTIIWTLIDSNRTDYSLPTTIHPTTPRMDSQLDWVSSPPSSPLWIFLNLLTFTPFPPPSWVYKRQVCETFYSFSHPLAPYQLTYSKIYRFHFTVDKSTRKAELIGSIEDVVVAERKQTLYTIRGGRYH